MNNYIVLFDAQNTEDFESTVQPLLDESWQIQSFDGIDQLGSLHKTRDAKVLFWLGDKELYDMIPYASEHNWTVGFLPHPEMNRFYRAFPISKKIEEALEDIKTTDTPVQSDLLYCNDHLVLGSVMTGNPDIMRPASNIDNSIWSKLKHLTLMTFNLSKVSLLSYKLETEKGSTVNTAALGITLVYRPSGSDFTKRVIGETLIDQSTLNAIILAPRSISEVVRFLFSRLFPNKEGAQSLANYIGHITTPSIKVRGDKKLCYRVDGEAYEAEEILLNVEPNALNVVSKALPDKEKAEDIKESICVNTLPKGQAIKELINRPLPWIHHVDQEEVKDTFVSLKESAQLTESYLVLTVLSTLFGHGGVIC